LKISSDDERFSAPRAAPKWPVRIGIGLGLLAFVAVVAWGALSLMKDGKSSKRQVVQISLLRPPPPPPPPPPPEQKPPEPEVKEEVKLPEPEQPPEAAKEEAPPPGEQLGLDAAGSGDGDGFGLAARKGGRDITTLGGPSGGGRGQAWFAGLVQSHLMAQLSKDGKLRRSDYRVQLRIWFATDGRIERFELVDSTGNKEVDDQIKLALHNMPPLKQPPPNDLPQPVKLRLTSRGAA
jgi:periplasmic protein TonB